MNWGLKAWTFVVGGGWRRRGSEGLKERMGDTRVGIVVDMAIWVRLRLERDSHYYCHCFLFD